MKEDDYSRRGLEFLQEVGEDLGRAGWTAGFVEEDADAAEAGDGGAP